MNIEFQFGKMVKILEVDGGDDLRTVWMYLISLKYTLTYGKNIKKQKERKRKERRQEKNRNGY